MRVWPPEPRLIWLAQPRILCILLLEASWLFETAVDVSSGEVEGPPPLSLRVDETVANVFDETVLFAVVVVVVVVVGGGGGGGAVVSPSFFSGFGAAFIPAGTMEHTISESNWAVVGREGSREEERRRGISYTRSVLQMKEPSVVKR